MRHCVLADHAKKLSKEKRGLLIIDNHESHINEQVLTKVKALNSDVEFLPANCTGQLQPLDIEVNRLFKELYSEKWENWFQEILDKKWNNSC